MTDDSDALTLRNGRVALRLMFSTAKVGVSGVAYWLLPLHDDAPMFPAHMFRQLEHEIDAGQPPANVFALESQMWLTWALREALDRGKVARWQGGLDVTAMIIPVGRGSPSLTDRGALPADWFDVIFAFHAARSGRARWNCHDAGPCVRLSVQRAMLERFCRALGDELRARVPPDPWDLECYAQSGPPDDL